MATTPYRPPRWLFFAAAMLLVPAWQGATVAANFGGHWTALFCTGALLRHPPLVDREQIYLFAGSTGYDGQFYHYIAHDPFLRSGLDAYIDDAPQRYRRILVPLLAYLMALGDSRLIDPAYESVFLLSIELGVYWSCRLVRQLKLNAAWGLLFLALPAIPIAADRLVVDATLASLTAAFLCYADSPAIAIPVLACAALARETGLLLIAAYCAWLFLEGKVRQAAMALLSALPAGGWYWYVHTRTARPTQHLTLAPFRAVSQALVHPWHYAPGIPFADAVCGADYLALAGLLLAFGLACVWFARKPSDLWRLVAMAFTAMGLLMNLPGSMLNVYHFGRIYTPLLLCLAAVAARDRKPWLLAPLALILPRIVIQLAPQALGIVRWIV